MSETYVLPKMLAALLADHGMTQSALAAELGVSASAVNQVLRPDHALQEHVFVRYTAQLGYHDELEALEAGIAALRRAERRELAPNGTAKASKKSKARKASTARRTRRATA